MIVRIWWPLQSALARRRPLAWAVLGAGAAALAALAARGTLPSQRELLALGVLATVAPVLLLASAAAGCAVALVAVAAAATAALAGGVAAGQAALVAAIVIALPAAAQVLRTEPAATQLRSGRATTVAAMVAQFAAVGALPTPAVLPGIAVALLLTAGVLVPALTPPAADPATPQPLRPPTLPPTWPLPLLLAAATLVALAFARADGATTAAIATGRPLLWLLPLVALWTLYPLRPAGALAGIAALAAASGTARLAGIELAPLPVALAQAVPFLLLLEREPAGGAPRATLAMALGAVAIALAMPAWLPALAGAAAAALVLAAVGDPRAARRDGDAIARAGAPLAALPPYWRIYGTMKLRLDPVYRRLAGDARPWGRVLDLGCGPGLGAALAHARGDATAWTGVDLDLDKLRVAQRVLALTGRSGWTAIHGRAPLDPPPAERSDTVLLLDVLHYWPRDIQRAVLTQARALLADDGVLWLRDGCATAGDAGRVGLGERFTTALGLNPRGGLCFLDETGMRALLAETGFTVLACEPSGAENRLWLCEGAGDVGLGARSSEAVLAPRPSAPSP